MFSFTKQERMALLSLSMVLFVGSVFSFACRKIPMINQVVDFVEKDLLCDKIDLNTATVEDLVRVPSIGRVTAQSIVNFREQAGGFVSVEQLKKVPGIGQWKYDKISPMFK